MDKPVRYARLAVEALGWAVLSLTLMGAVSLKTEQGTLHLFKTSFESRGT